MSYDFVSDTVKLDEIKSRIVTIAGQVEADIAQLYSLVDGIQGNGGLVGDAYETFTSMNTEKYREELNSIATLLNAYANILGDVIGETNKLNTEIVEACNI